MQLVPEVSGTLGSVESVHLISVGSNGGRRDIRQHYSVSQVERNSGALQAMIV